MERHQNSGTASTQGDQNMNKNKDISTPPHSPRLVPDGPIKGQGSSSSLATNLPLSPPRYILEKLTPVGTKKFGLPTVSLDLSEHNMRRDKLIQEKVERNAQYAREVDRKKMRAQVQRDELRQMARKRSGEKMKRACERRREVIEKKRMLASKFQKTACLHDVNAGVTEFVDPVEPRDTVSASTEETFESDFAETYSRYEETIRRALRNWKTRKIFKLLRATAPFGSSLSLSVTMGYERAMLLIQHKTLIESVKFVLHDCFGLVEDKWATHYARIFLYSFVLVLEKMDPKVEDPSYDTTLPKNQEEYETYLERLPQEEAKMYKDNVLYKCVLKEAIIHSENILVKFRDLVFAPTQVSLNGNSPERLSFAIAWFQFSKTFESYLLLHRQRTRILLMNVANVLQREINLLNFLSENDQRDTNEYKIAMQALSKRAEHTKKSLRKLESENAVYGHQKEFLLSLRPKFVISDGNPLVHSNLDDPALAVTEVPDAAIKFDDDLPPLELLRFAAWSSDMKPPGLLINQWRRILVMMMYNAEVPTGPKIVMRSGTDKAFKKDIETQLSERFDLDSARESLGLQSYQDACEEVNSKLGLLDDVEDMMDVVFDISKQLFLSLNVVYETTENGKQKLLVRYSYFQHRKSIHRICKVQDLKRDYALGTLDCDTYFRIVSRFVLEEASFKGSCFEELREFLRADRPKTRDFIMKYVDIIAECIIFGARHWCSSFFKVIKDDLVQFERHCFSQMYASENLDLKYSLCALNSFIASHLFSSRRLLERADLALTEEWTVSNLNTEMTSHFFAAAFVEMLSTFEKPVAVTMDVMPETMTLLKPQIVQLCNRVNAYIYTNVVCMLFFKYFEELKSSSTHRLNATTEDSLHIFFDQPRLMSEIYEFFQANVGKESFSVKSLRVKRQLVEMVKNHVKRNLVNSSVVDSLASSIADDNIDKDTLYSLVDKVQSKSVQTKSLMEIVTCGMQTYLLAKKYDYMPNPIGDDLSAYSDENKLGQLRRSSLKFFIREPQMMRELESIARETYKIFGCSFTIYRDFYFQSLRSYLSDMKRE